MAISAIHLAWASPSVKQPAYSMVVPAKGLSSAVAVRLPAVLPAGWAAEEDPPPPQAASMLTIITMASKNASLERCFFMFFVLLYMC